jgi:hypothetical protein
LNRTTITFLLSLFQLISVSSARQLAAKKPQNGGRTQEIIRKLRTIENGISLGTDARIIPYASLEDWFEPYGGFILDHGAFWNRADRMGYLFKFETLRDYSLKLRYAASTLSNEQTQVGFQLKLKFDRDADFYGIGNDTTEDEREPATYGSFFMGWEVTHAIGKHLALRWTPGFWTFKSGLIAGGEFERASAANYISSRFVLSDSQTRFYWNTPVGSTWNGYVEVGIPVSSDVASYFRFNIQTHTQMPIVGKLQFHVLTRHEYVASPDRSQVPYFALPEVGSKSDLRGYAKERFRNYGLSLINLELPYPVIRDMAEVFLFGDFAQTTNDFSDIFDEKLHYDFGIAARLIHPLIPTAGFAIGPEGWQLFSSIAFTK